MKRTVCALLVLFTAATLAWAETPVDQTKPAKPDGRVKVETVAGSITVTGWDKAEVRVQGTLGDQMEPLVFEVTDGTTRIEAEPKKNARGDGSAHLQVWVPKGSSVEAAGVSADVAAKGISGSVEVGSVSGDVKASGISGELVAECVSGGVEVEASGRSLRCETVSGRLQVTGGSPERVQLQSVSGGINYTGSLARTGQLTAETVSGDVELALPSSFSADFDVSTFSGAIRSDLSTPANVQEEGPVGKKAAFTTGSGDAHVKVETFSGSVRFLAK